jgi:regulator of replication initiation timing
MRKILVLFILFSTTTQVYSQSEKFTRAAIEIGGGTPFLFGELPANVSTNLTLGARYSLSKEISAQLSYQLGSMVGSQTPASALLLPVEQVQNYKSYKNSFYQLSANVQLNLEPLLKLRKFMPRINPYILAGMGRIYSDIEAERLDRTRVIKDFDFYTLYGGISVKYYINPQLDFLVNIAYHTTQSAWVDGIPTTKKFDSYLMPSIGVQYKVAGNATRKHVDWYNVVQKDRKSKVVDPDNIEDKPIAQQAIDKAKAKADSLANQNVVITKENSELKQEINELKEENADLKKENTQLKEELTKPIIDPKTGQPIVAQRQTYKPGETENNSGKSGASGSDQKGSGKIGATSPSGSLNQYDGITTPPHKYNVVVGCYNSKRYAFIFRDRMRAQGYDAAIFRSSPNSTMLRVTILSTDDKAEAQRAVNKARKEIEPGSWMHIYNPQP